MSDTHRPRRRVRITRLYGKGQRALDRNNLWGGTKLVVDMLQPPRVFRRRMVKDGPLYETLRPGASLIVDDSDKWCDLIVDQERASDGIAATRIVIADLGPLEVP